MSKPDFDTLSADNIVAFIGDIFERRGADSYLGEQVTMSEHMLQGARLAEQAGADETLVAAALLHDIGHYTNEFPEDALEQGIDNLHDEAGAAVLAPFFPTVVTDCVRYHVAAKRYLCATDDAYFGRLSAASVHTLGLQGGPMNAQEVEPLQPIPISTPSSRCASGMTRAKCPVRSRRPSPTMRRCCSVLSMPML